MVDPYQDIIDKAGGIELVEKVCRILCKWQVDEDDNPINADATLGGDGENFRWREEIQQACEIIEVVRNNVERIRIRV
jgi:hypothetical protein